MINSWLRKNKRVLTLYSLYIIIPKIKKDTCRFKFKVEKESIDKNMLEVFERFLLILRISI